MTCKRCSQVFAPRAKAKLYCSAECRIRDKGTERNNYRKTATAVYNFMRHNCPNVLQRILADIGLPS